MVATAAAGAMGGALAKTTVAPLERTKIYFQTHPERRYRIKGALRYLKKLYNQDGVLSLWRGNSANMVRVIPYAAIQFMSHEQYKKLLGVADRRSGSSPEQKHLRHFLAGAMAGTTSQAMTYPLDRARAVMAVTHVGEYRNIFHVFTKILEREGFLAMYRGLSPTMIGIIPYAGISFSTYEMLMRKWTERLKQQGQEGDPTHVQKLVSGGCAGLIGQASAYPLDIVRRRMQTATQMGIESSRYSSITGTLKIIVEKEGFRKGLYKGYSMNCIKGPITSGICFMTYEHFKKFWNTLLLK